MAVTNVVVQLPHYSLENLVVYLSVKIFSLEWGVGSGEWGIGSGELGVGNWELRTVNCQWGVLSVPN
jgi:hypothetical protein